jgi:hypothetical protein
VSNATPLKGAGNLQKPSAINRPASGRSTLHGGRGKGLNLPVQNTIVFATDIRKPAERIDAGRDQPIQNRNHLSPHSIPQVMRLEIAGILPKRQPCRAEIDQDLLPLDIVQRPNNLVIAECRHAGKTREPRATEYPEQDCLCLIVCRMAYGDTVRPARLGDFLHYPIAEVTGFSLQRCLAPAGMEFNPSNMERNSEPLTKGLHKFLVLVGLSPS